MSGAPRRRPRRQGLDTTRVVAKIEDREGLTNYQSIIDAADGIIFSRGNLGGPRRPPPAPRAPPPPPAPPNAASATLWSPPYFAARDFITPPGRNRSRFCARCCAPGLPLVRVRSQSNGTSDTALLRESTLLWAL